MYCPFTNGTSGFQRHCFSSDCRLWGGGTEGKDGCSFELIEISLDDTAKSLKRIIKLLETIVEYYGIDEEDS